MARNIYGGGSKTNLNGLGFEQETSLTEAIIKIKGYTVKNGDLYFNGSLVGIIAGKNTLYTKLLIPKGVHYESILSKKLLPDEAIYIKPINKVFIIEKKFQNCAGSVDEKLQTCDFKRKQYEKLFESTGIQPIYLYIFNDWFKKPQYKDVLNYIEESHCHYFFNEIPLDFLGLQNETEEVSHAWYYHYFFECR